MAASAGIAKRATISVGARFDQETINKFEQSLRDIHRTDESLTDSFDRTNQALDRFNEHLSTFSQHHDEIMDRLRESDNKVSASDERNLQRYHHAVAIHNDETQKYVDDMHKQNEASLQRAKNEVDNDREQIRYMAKVMSRLRDDNSDMSRIDQHLKDRLNGIGNTSKHMSNRVASANGRVSRSFGNSSRAVDQHMKSIRTAQSHDYRWLRTAQDMSGATLGLGAAFYKGAKDATTLQQAYIHAGNMAHYGGERMSSVQHNINRQWSVGSNLAVKYGINQDQIAKGYQALVARGYSTNEALHTQKSLLQAAIASGDNYNDVVKDSTNVLDAYNMRSNNAATMTNNTKHVVNEMAYAADQTATNFQGLGIGMSYVAATAHTTHQSISETSSALGILSNKGMQASQAGVGLRKVLNSFLSVNKKGQQAQVMQQLGLNESDFKTASGHLKSLGSLMTLLNNKTKNMDSQERGSIFHRFFGATGQEAALNLASDTSGLRQLNNQVERSQTMGKNHQGYVALLSAHNMKSAQNQLHRFQQAWQAFTITSAREILPTLTHALQHMDVYISKLNNLSPHTKKWTIFGALFIASIAPISYTIFGIQSAFHGLEITMLHVRRIFSKPVSSNMRNSMAKQGAEDDIGANLTKDGSSAGTLSRVAKYDRGGIGYRTLSMLRNHPGTIAGVGSAVTLGVGMGEFLGNNANRQAAKQVSHLHKSFNLPTTDKIKAELTNASVRNTINAGHKLNTQLQSQNKQTYNNVANQLKNFGRQQKNDSANNLKLLEKYHLISKRDAKNRLRNDQTIDKSRLQSATRAINRISKDDGRHSKRIPQDYAKAYRAVNRLVAGNGSRQNQIYRRLENSNYKISKRNARGLVANSYKTTHGEIKAAKRSYQATRKNEWNKYSSIKHAVIAEYGYRSKKYNQLFGKNGIETKAYSKSITNARNWKNAKVKVYSNEQRKVVSAADKESNSQIKDNGKVWTSWDTTKHVFKSMTSSIISDAERLIEKLDVLKSVGLALSNLVGKVHGAISHISFLKNLSSAADNAGEFGKTHAATHAMGGYITHNEMSLVGEQGPEAAYNPRHNTFRMLGNNGPQVSELYTGEHILNAIDTRRLLTEGLGRGVKLPGYANGTDTLSGVHRAYAIGTGRAGDISSEEASEPKWLQHLDSEMANTAESFSPSNMLRVPQDSKSALLAKGLKGKISNGASVLGDLPDSDFLKSVSGGLKGTKLGEKLLPKLGKLHNPLVGSKGLSGASSQLQGIGNAIKNPIGNIMSKVPILHATKGFLHKLPQDFSKVWPKLKGSMAIGRKFMLKALSGPIKRGIGDLHHNLPKWTNEAKRTFRHLGNNFAKFGHSMMHIGGHIFRMAGSKFRRFGRLAMHAGHRLWNDGKRLLSRAGHGIARFSKHTWSSAKHLGSRLWNGTRHVASRIWSVTKRTTGHMWSAAKRTASRMWNSAKRTGSHIWSNAKRIASNVGRTAKSLWSKTKSGASRTWSHVVTGARRMSSNVGHTTSRLFHEAVAKGHSAWSTIKSGAASAVNHAKSLINGLKSAASEAASWIQSKLSHIHMPHLPHFATGGPIHRSTMALVGEHGPETAYDARTGQVRLLGIHGPQITELLAGEQVLTNTQTERLLHSGLGSGVKLPAYAKGTNTHVQSIRPRSSAMSIIGRFNGSRALNKMSSFRKKSESIWDDISESISKTTKDTHSSSTDEWKDMATDITKINSDLSDTVRSIFKEMKKKVESLSSDLHDGLVSAAEDMASGFGEKFEKLIDYAKSDMEGVIDKLNKGISGIDSALRAFGGNSHVIHAIHYATGSGFLTHNQIGILNDATSGPRQESILRNGQLLFPHGDNVRVPLRRGDAVLNGTQTKEISNITNVNHYAKGSGLHLSSKLIKGLTTTLGLALKGPKKFFQKTFDKMIGSDTGHQLTKGIEQLGMNVANPLGIKWTKAMFDYIKNLLSPSTSGGSSNSVLLNEMHKLGDGHTYLWGASGPTHYDCGGLVMAALHALGMPSEHTVYPYPRIPAKDATTGDIVQSAKHVGVVADPHAKTYFSAYGPNLAKDSIKTQPLTNEYFTPGYPYYFRRPWKLYHEDQRNMGENSKAHKSNNGLISLVKRELGPSATSWLKKMASIISDGSGSATNEPNPSGSNVRRFIPEIKTAATTMHAHLTSRLIDLLLGTISNESGGQPDASNDYDVNAGPNHSVGLLQYTRDTWDAYALPGHADRTNAYDNFLTYFNNSQYASALVGYDSANGKSGGEWNPAHGSGPGGSRRFSKIPAANGGWADKSHMRIFGEAGPEVAINPRRDTADHYIIEAIDARIHHNPSSPIAGLIKSLDIKKRGRELFSDIQSMLAGNVNSQISSNQSNSSKPIKINVNTNITINGNPGSSQYNQIKNKIAKAVRRGVQKEALQARNALSW